MDLRIEVNMDNAAFNDKGSEVARILRKLADRAEIGVNHEFTNNIKDHNGNNVGRVCVDLTADEEQQL